MGGLPPTLQPICNTQHTDICTHHHPVSPSAHTPPIRRPAPPRLDKGLLSRPASSNSTLAPLTREGARAGLRELRQSWSHSHSRVRSSPMADQSHTATADSDSPPPRRRPAAAAGSPMEGLDNSQQTAGRAPERVGLDHVEERRRRRNGLPGAAAMDAAARRWAAAIPWPVPPGLLPISFVRARAAPAAASATFCCARASSTARALAAPSASLGHAGS